MDIWLTLWLLYNYYYYAIGIFIYKILCEQMFSILLGKYLGVQLLGHMELFNFFSFEELPNCFSQWLHHLTFPLAMYGVGGGISISPHSAQYLLLFL